MPMGCRVFKDFVLRDKGLRVHGLGFKGLSVNDLRVR